MNSISRITIGKMFMNVIFLDIIKLRFYDDITVACISHRYLTICIGWFQNDKPRKRFF